MPVTTSTNEHAKPRVPVFTEGARGQISTALLNSVAPQPPPLIFNAAAKSTEYADRMRAHYRETRRTSVDIPCSLELVLADGEIFDAGSARLRNISPSGAFVTQMLLSGGSLPAAPFKLRMILNGDPYAGIGIEASPVRMASDGGFGLGVKFDEIFVAV